MTFQDNCADLRRPDYHSSDMRIRPTNAKKPEVMSKTRVLENVKGVEFVTLSLDREMLVSTDLRHSLIREEIRKDRMT
jgi:hypothetical protein